MTPVEWTAILALAGGVVDLAIKIARVFMEEGCDVEGCPHDVAVRLNTTAIPAEDDAMFAGRTQAAARVRGLDKATIARQIRGVARAGVGGIDDGDTDPGGTAA